MAFAVYVSKNNHGGGFPQWWFVNSDRKYSEIREKKYTRDLCKMLLLFLSEMMFNINIILISKKN